MPIYEYRCEKCGHLAEVMQKMSDPAPDRCDACGGGPMEKQLSKSSFALKGSGWYVTDFKGNTPAKESSAEGTSSTKSESSGSTPSKPSGN